MTTSAPQKTQSQWIGSQSPADANTMEFGLSSISIATSSSRVEDLRPPSLSLSSLSTAGDDEHNLLSGRCRLASSESVRQRMYSESSSASRNYLGLAAEIPLDSSTGRSVVQPLGSTFNRSTSEPFPSPIGRNNFRNDINQVGAKSPGSGLSTPLDGSDLFRNPGSALSQSFASFLTDAANGKDDDEMRGAASSKSVNNSKYNENGIVEGIGGISLSPTVNRGTISEARAKQFASESTGVLLQSSNFDEDYSPSGKFLDSPYRNTVSIRSRAFSSPGPIELSRMNQGTFPGAHKVPESPSASSFSGTWDEHPRKGLGHHIRSFTAGYIPEATVDDEGEFKAQGVLEDLNESRSHPTFRSNLSRENNVSHSRGSPGSWQNTPLTGHRLTMSKSDAQFPRSLPESQSYMGSASEMGRSSSYDHIPGGPGSQTPSSSIQRTGFDQSSGTPRSALYYPEKEGHYGQIDPSVTGFQNDESIHGASHASHTKTYSETSASFHSSPNGSNPGPVTMHNVPGYPYQRHQPSPSMDAYATQQMNFQSQPMQSQIQGQFSPPYLAQQMMMQPQQMRAMQLQHSYNMHGMNPHMQQHVAAVQQGHGIQHGHMQGHQRVFIPGMGTMIMSTTTGPDGESIGHLSFPPGVNPMVGPSSEASTVFPYNVHQAHGMLRGSSQGNLNGAGVYQNNISLMQQEEILAAAGTSDVTAVHQGVPHNQQQQDGFSQGSQSSSPAIAIVDSSVGNINKELSNSMAPVVIQTHGASPSVPHVAQKQHSMDQILVPVYGVHKTSGGVAGETMGSPTPKIVYNVKFKRTQRSFILGPRAPRDIKVGCFVKVEADRGEDLGIVVSRVPAEKYNITNRSGFRGCNEPPTAGAGAGSCGASDLKKVVRLATEEEISLLEDKKQEEDALLKVCRAKVKQRGLNMNVVDAEYQFDRHKLIFFFEAEGRVDFRELVRDLFSIYKTRIWMQQLDKGGNGTNGVGICASIGDDFEDGVCAPNHISASSLSD